MDLGLIGLGKMGGNMRERIRRAGHTVVGYDRNPDVSDVDSLEALVDALPGPRKVVWVMVPAGDPTRETVDELGELLGRGRRRRRRRQLPLDRRQEPRRAARRQGHRLRRLRRLRRRLGPGERLRADGRRRRRRTSPRSQPIFDALKPEGEFGWVHAGKVGAGHFSKMVHNGIEYAMMQSYAEGWELLRGGRRGRQRHRGVPLLARGHGHPVLAARPARRRAGRRRRTSTRSRGYAEDSGEGRWTVEAGDRQRGADARRSPRRSSRGSPRGRTTAPR